MYSNFNHNKSPKKKKRKHSVDNCAINSNRANQSALKTTGNNTINIIDRVLDLSKYDKETGLYSLSRDWINATTMVSDIKNTNKESVISATDQQNNDYFIYSLPGPNRDHKSQDIRMLNEEIQKSIRSSEKSDLNLISSLNVDEYMQTHALLKLHVNRWKQARNKWQSYYKDSNKAYEDSYCCLKSILEDYE